MLKAMLSNKLMTAALFAGYCFLLGPTGIAYANPEVLPAWADHTQTRALEELLRQAMQKKDASVLTSAHAEIVAKDQDAIILIQSLIEEGDTDALRRISMGMTPCHHAGVIIRLLILSAYGAVETGSNREIVISSDEAARFAENMGRCERMSKTPATQRLIGGG
jgi:hypothetical protein